MVQRRGDKTGQEWEKSEAEPGAASAAPNLPQPGLGQIHAATSAGEVLLEPGLPFLGPGLPFLGPGAGDVRLSAGNGAGTIAAAAD